MKVALFSILAGVTAAFAPSAKVLPSTSLQAASFENELGVQPPLGFWDPIGMLDNASEAQFDRLRYVEIKHGRVAMLAFLGNIITRAGLHLPGSLNVAGTVKFDAVPNGFAALKEGGIPLAATLQIIGFCGFLEFFVMKDLSDRASEPNEFIGDFRNGVRIAAWDNFDEETKLKKRAFELNNGRAAMFGIFGLMVHEQLGGVLPIVGQM